VPLFTKQYKLVPALEQ